MKPNWPIVLCLVFWLLVISACNRSLFYREDAVDFHQWALSMKAPSRFATLDNISRWMKQHMRYEADGLIDNPKPYLQTWWQSGDCEDFAIVAIEALKVCGYNDFWLQSVWYGDSGHTVCTDGSYHVGNWGLILVPIVSEDKYENVAKAVNPDWYGYTARDINWAVIKKGKK